MRKFLPIILLVVGTGAGVGMGILLRSPLELQNTATEEVVADSDNQAANEQLDDELEAEPREYVKINNQFIVPVVGSDSVTALVVLTLSLEVTPGNKSIIYEQEPKIRDAFLQVLFDHANIGGFDGAFTNANTLDMLRAGLREAAQKNVGNGVTDVLILDIARQDY